MTVPRLGLVVAVLVLLAAGAGAALPAWGAVLAAVALALGAAAAARWSVRRRIGAIARTAGGWSGHPPTWDGLERYLDELAAAYRELALRTERGDPWRLRLVRSVEEPALLFSQEEERLVAANEAARELLGIPSGDQDLTLVQALGSAALAGAAREAREIGRPVQVDAEVNGRDLRATASAIGGEILVIVSDRTEQRRVEELRRNFVVNASHELKTPATAIQTLAEALQVAVGTGSPRTPELVERLGEESERLVRTVHDLLDLRRLEERGPLERVPVDVAALCRDVATEYRGRAEAVGVELAVEAPESAFVAGLAQDLRIAVANLVANAIQYNRPGGTVTVRLEPGDGAYLLSVADTGVGIPQQDLQRVFERFYRIDRARSRERGGTGLGLSIVRHAVERHGGSVSVTSLLGEGSTFVVRLPIEPPR